MFRLAKIRVDGHSSWLEIRPEPERLSGALRSLGKTLPTSDCADGRCGACTVMLGDRPVKSCTVATEDCTKAEVWTADHLDDGPGVHPMLAAFRRHGIPACETCMPGMLIAAIAYAARGRELTEDEIHDELIADTCRCEFAKRIAAAILEGAKAMHGRR
jgi:carbon-monoxide dehydrogenase small subunit